MADHNSEQPVPDAPRKLGEAVESTIESLEKRVPDTGRLFREEYIRTLTGRNNTWYHLPETYQSGLFADLLKRMKMVESALPQFEIKK